MDKQAIIRRIDEILALDLTANDATTLNTAAAGTLTVLGMVYGTGAPQHRKLEQVLTQAYERQGQAGVGAFRVAVAPVIRGFLRSTRADVDAGLVTSVEARAVGGVLADFLGLAKQVLEETSAGAVNVAAVLVAAAFEDTIRRMGETVAVQGRPDLNAVIGALKDAGLLSGAPLSTALSYLKFRNDALHADWSKIDRAVVGSCLAFVEGLLLERFA